MKKDLKYIDYNLIVTWQPLNNTWGVLFKNGNNIHNEVNESLTTAFAEIAKYIESLSEIVIEYGNGETVTKDLKDLASARNEFIDNLNKIVGI